MRHGALAIRQRRSVTLVPVCSIGAASEAIEAGLRKAFREPAGPASAVGGSNGADAMLMAPAASKPHALGS
jgi:hypothetical protein